MYVLHIIYKGALPYVALPYSPLAMNGARVISRDHDYIPLYMVQVQES